MDSASAPNNSGDSTESSDGEDFINPLNFSGTESNEDFIDDGYIEEPSSSDSSDESGILPKDVKKAVKKLFRPNQVGDVVVVASDSDGEENSNVKTLTCKVYGCKSKKEAFPRGSFVVNFYKLYLIENPVICDSCFKKAVKSVCRAHDFELHKISELPSQGKAQIDVINICEDDEEDNSGALDNAELVNFCENGLTDLIKKIDSEKQIKSKFDEAAKKLEARIDRLTVATNELHCKLDMEDQDMVKCIQDFYLSFRPPLEETSIDVGTENVDKPDPTPKPATILSEKPGNLPPRGMIIRKKLIVGQKVYALKVTEFYEWVPGSVQTIFVKDSDAQMCYSYKVKVEASPTCIYVKEVKEEHLAYFEPSPVRIAVGNRVISVFHDTNKPDRGAKFYAGVTAESPSSVNKYRYMIFFDNGNVQYSTHDELRVVCKARNSVHEYFPLSSQHFIRDYFEKLPQRRILNVNTMDLVKIELKGKWMDARVTCIDCSLMEVFFPKANTKEWLYRGSSRIMSLADYESRAALIRESQKESNENATTHVPRASRQTNPRRKRVIIYSNLEEDADDSSENVDDGKSNSGVRSLKKTITRTNLEPKPVDAIASLRDEFAGQIVTDMVLDAQFPRQMKKHNTCVEECIRWTNYSVAKCKGRNPLIIPLLFGFRRVDHCPMGSARNIYYESPCGRLLTDFEDLLAYLHMTRSQLSVDMFNFDPWVKIYDEFKASPEYVLMRDLSNGTENTPITVVNSLDSQVPPYMEYITKRRPTEGVPLNTDPNFLTSCDCVDDCMDRLKCSCWQKTIKDYFDLLMPADLPNREMATDYQTIGYQNRRLLDNVPSGIFECNSNCKCANTCLNRVVQQPLTVKLELFKTKMKGWGTRCLNDIPAGGFICVYVGNILNEQNANEGGRKHGDEYFAELDYIEVMEQLKQGYESGPSDPENEEDDYFHGMNEDSSSSTEAEPKSFGLSIPTKERKKSLREYYGKNETVYIMDAKAAGNIGRYLNHSCAPNIFVQSVFVDTHDLRFPWVAFFAKHYIKAGTELTWDYQYVVDTVPGKVMYCHCGTPECKGRLL